MDGELQSLRRYTMEMESVGRLVEYFKVKLGWLRAYIFTLTTSTVNPWMHYLVLQWDYRYTGALEY